MANVVGDLSILLIIAIFWAAGAWLLNLVDMTWPGTIDLSTDNKRMLWTTIATVAAITIVSMVTKRGILGWCNQVAGLFGNYNCNV
jgi:putative effector of murein hydrolase LrgA (UPF0299 family)